MSPVIPALLLSFSTLIGNLYNNPLIAVFLCHILLLNTTLAPLSRAFLGARGEYTVYRINFQNLLLSDTLLYSSIVFDNSMKKPVKRYIPVKRTNQGYFTSKSYGIKLPLDTNFHRLL